VGELSTCSEDFRVRWARHDVRLHRTGRKHFNHPVVGQLHLSFDALALPTDTGLTLTAFTAEAGTPDDDALQLLAVWAATARRDPHPDRGAAPVPRIGSHRDLARGMTTRPPVAASASKRVEKISVAG
jgi:hypothetical protein